MSVSVGWRRRRGTPWKRAVGIGRIPHMVGRAGGMESELNWIRESRADLTLVNGN